MTQEKKEKLEKFFSSLSLSESQHLIKEDLGIDGYRNYLPLDMPVENIMKQVRIDFEDYVLPEINRIHKK